MTDTFKTKLGTTRAGERSRIWIEGNRLLAHGFLPGMHFSRTWGEDKLTLRTLSEAAYHEAPAATRGKVSGKDGSKPIIDITGELVRSTFGQSSHVNVKYSMGRITITRNED